MKAMKEITVCYLCGNPLSLPANRDHIPPDQFFGPGIRKRHALQLRTAPVHAACNSAYMLDEDYFVQMLVPYARGSEAGDAVRIKAMSDYHAGSRSKVALINQILAAFDDKPGGFLLPNRKIAFKMDGHRVQRVVWKIVRGLHFLECMETLPTEHDVIVEITPPGETPPDHFQKLNFGREDKGSHPGVFAYWRQSIRTEAWVDYWAMLIWDRIIVTAYYHLPDCPCDECIDYRLHQREQNAAGG